MSHPCAPACEPDDDGRCQLAEDITKLTGKTMLDSILATSPPEPRARGVVPPTEPLQGPQEAAQRLSAPVYVNGTHIKIPTDRIKGLAPPLMPTIAPDGMPRGGLLPDPYAIPDEGDPQ